MKKGVKKFLRNSYDGMACGLIEIKRVNKDVIKHKLNVRKKGQSIKAKNEKFFPHKGKKY